MENKNAIIQNAKDVIQKAILNNDTKKINVEFAKFKLRNKIEARQKAEKLKKQLNLPNAVKLDEIVDGLLAKAFQKLHNI